MAAFARRPPQSAGGEAARWAGAGAAPARPDRPPAGRRGRGRAAFRVRSGAEPNWDDEMVLFRRRANSPNQLETLRKLEADVEVGKVLYAGEGVAIVDGLNNDAPVGTTLSFVGGASGVLLWRHTDSLCFVLLLGGRPERGEGVVCKINAILQLVDEKEGPSTKRDYDIASVPVGDGLAGQVTDFLGRPAGSGLQVGSCAQLPLLNQQVPVDEREQICESLLTGVKAIDVLTPIGRGQAQLVTGPPASGKSAMVLDAIVGQQATDVWCVYAAVGQSAAETEEHAAFLRLRGALSYTSVVAAPAPASLGERFAALCSACSQGERIRDGGGHALVVLDDISCMSEMWDHVSAMLARLAPDALGLPPGEGRDDPQRLVEYEGMLVSVAAAQRRRFFSALVQRAAKTHRRKGGGSLTLLLVLPGQPATGRRRGQAPDPAQYKHLSPELRAKLQAALAARGGRGGAAGAAQPLGPGGRGCSTEVVEEFMSMADGQTVVSRAGPSRGAPAGLGPEPRAASASGAAAAPTAADQAVRVDAAASVSRIGGRAHPPALRQLAQTARLELSQAGDAARFSSAREEGATAAALQLAAQLDAALEQRPGHPVPLEEQVAMLWALQSRQLRSVPPRRVPLWLGIYVQLLRRTQPGLMRTVGLTQALTPDDQARLQEVLEEAFAQFGTLADA